MRIISILFLFFSFTSFGQKAKIVGKIIDEEKNPIYGATILYKKDVSIGAYSDENGNYLLEIPVGEALIIFRYTGMVADTVRVNPKSEETITLNITMKPYVQQIDGVEVKVGKFDRPLEEQTVSLEIIRPDLIENKNTRSIEKALDQTPGLNILDGEPQIRGGSGFTFGVGSKVAVIVDDMPMLSGDAGRPEWGFIPVENIHQIEVTKGAASVLSGSSALSGAIHIRTAYPKLKPLTKVNVYGGIYSEPNVEGGTWWKNTPLIAGANVLHSRQIGNLDLVLGANMNYDHGYIGAPITDSLVIKDTLSNFTEKQMSSKRARINFNLRYRSKKFKGLNYGLNGNLMFSQSNLTFAWLNDSSGLFRAYPGAVFLQDQFIFNLDPFVNFFTSTEGKHSLRMRMLHSDNQMTANQSNVATTYYADYMFQKTLPRLKGVDFVGGLTGSYVDSKSNMYVGSGSPNNHVMNVSAYTQLEKKIYKALNLSVGGRLEYFALNDTVTAIKPIFRAGGSVKVLQETYVRASYGQGYRFPTITERYIRTGVGNFGVFPNNELKAESSWNAEVGVKQGIKLGKLYAYFDVAGFWQEYQNTIEYLFGFWGDPSGGIGEVFGFRFVNTGKSRVLGIDASFSGKAKIGKNAEFNFITGYNYILPTTLNPDYVYAIDKINREYSYNKTSLDSTRGILKYRFLHNVKADFELVLHKKFAIGISAKYFSKIINMDGVIEEFELATQGPYIQTIRYMDYFRSHQHGNWIFDARISYAINEQHKIAIISANVLNRVYSLRPLKIEQPRTIMLQYSFKIDKN
jgi:outer membrane receptor protein involved in Fe transport